MTAPAEPAAALAPGARARQRRAVGLIVVAQWLGTSLWFSPSGAADGLITHLGIGAAAFGWLVAATQLGFIAGTFAFAATGAADRFAASRIFAVSGVLGAAANAAAAWPELGFASVWALRFAVGVCLAGIYPLGMKMVVQWVGARPAAALGWLVGMLTLGTAMPHAVRAMGVTWSWPAVIVASSVLALAGAGIVRALGDGPFAPAPPRRSGTASRVASGAPSASPAGTLRDVFAVPGFRASALAYFGHMWELYAFWSVLPWLCRPVAAELARHAGTDRAPPVAWLAFAVIAVGALGCIGGGGAARRFGSARVAAVALAGSAAMCLVYPLIPDSAATLRLAALLFWGVVVIADSPQFSALAAEHAPAERLGSALTAQNGIGFAITVASILLLNRAVPMFGAQATWLLAPGPLLGLVALRPLLRRPRDGSA